MTPWPDIARDSFVAAKVLRDAGHHRSAVSRAYYAAYARVTAELEGRASLPADREGPDHDDLPEMVIDYLSRMQYPARREVREILIRLYDYRLHADYRPSRVIGNAELRHALLLVDRLFRKVDHDHA